jgi:hypothetical protein
MLLLSKILSGILEYDKFVARNNGNSRRRL